MREYFQKRIAGWLILCFAIAGITGLTVFLAEETFANENASASSQVATKDEMAPSQQVGYEGMVVVFGKDVEDGTYDIDVDSSSSMFKIVSCKLQVKDGEMKAIMTMSAFGYLKVFMGTGKEAVAADTSEYIPFVENQDGAHTFTVPVEALNKVIDVAAFSKNKQQWYDRQLVFRADSIPEDAILADLDSNKLDFKDGEYTAEVKLKGTLEEVSVKSPASLNIKDGEAVAKVRWDSKSIDYMIVDSRKYFPISEEETSVFEVPIYVFDNPINVTLGGKNNGQIQEIQCTLTFDSQSIESKAGLSSGIIIGMIAAVVTVIIAVVLFLKKKK